MRSIQHHRHACLLSFSSCLRVTVKNCGHCSRSTPVPALTSCRAVDTFASKQRWLQRVRHITPSGTTPHCVSSDCSSVRSRIPGPDGEMQDSSLALRITDNGGSGSPQTKFPPGGDPSFLTLSLHDYRRASPDDQPNRSNYTHIRIKDINRIESSA